jgi:hypothetical protein
MGGRGAGYSKSIKVVRETNKALLITKDGKEGWIQKRWMRADGTLTPAGEKAFNENAMSVAEAKKIQSAKMQKQKEIEKARAKLEKEGVRFNKWERDGQERVYIKFAGANSEVSTYLERDGNEYYLRTKARTSDYNGMPTSFMRTYNVQARRNAMESAERTELSRAQDSLEKFMKSKGISNMDYSKLKKYFG